MFSIQFLFSSSVPRECRSTLHIYCSLLPCLLCSKLPLATLQIFCDVSRGFASVCTPCQYSSRALVCYQKSFRAVSTTRAARLREKCCHSFAHASRSIQWTFFSIIPSTLFFGWPVLCSAVHPCPSNRLLKWYIIFLCWAFCVYQSHLLQCFIPVSTFIYSPLALLPLSFPHTD